MQVLEDLSQNVHLLLERHEAAAADYDIFIEAAAADPTLGETGNYRESLGIAYGNRGYCRLMTGEYTAALSDLNECLAILPEYAWGYFTRGQILQELERYAEAKEDYDKANDLIRESE